MDLISEAYLRLFPEKDFPFQSELKYNLRLADFNANIRFLRQKIAINLNLQWKDIDDEIKIGLIQSLLLKVFKKRVHTPNIELYNHFIKNIPLLTPKNKGDPLLEESFRRVNEQFLEGKLEQPNLVWGGDSRRKLASYNFHNDTITVSSLFRKVSPEVLDYLMYHEMLHKWQKFEHRNGRSAFHTREFREAERQFPGQERIEKEIKETVHPRRKFFPFPGVGKLWR